MEESAAPATPYARLPEPIRLEEAITSANVSEHPPTPDDTAHEPEWLLRTTGGGL